MRRDSGWGLVDAVPAGPIGTGPLGHDPGARMSVSAPVPHRVAHDPGFNHFPPMVDSYGCMGRSRGNLLAVEANVALIRQLPSPSISYMDETSINISRQTSEIFGLQQEYEEQVGPLSTDREMSSPPQQRKMHVLREEFANPPTKADLPTCQERPALRHPPSDKDPAVSGPGCRMMHRNPVDPTYALKRLRGCAISDAITNRQFGTSWTAEDLELIFPVLVAVHEQTISAVAKEAAKLPPSIANKFPDPHVLSKQKSGKLQFLFAALQASVQEDAPEKRTQVLRACEIHLRKGMKLAKGEWDELRRVATETQLSESDVELKKAALSLEMTTNKFAGIICTQRWSVHDKQRPEEEVEYHSRRLGPYDDDVEISTKRSVRADQTAGRPVMDLNQNPLAVLAATPKLFEDMIAKLPGELWNSTAASVQHQRPLPPAPHLPAPQDPPLSSRRREEIRVMHCAMSDRQDQFIVM